MASDPEQQDTPQIGGALKQSFHHATGQPGLVIGILTLIAALAILVGSDQLLSSLGGRSWTEYGRLLIAISLFLVAAVIIISIAAYFARTYFLPRSGVAPEVTKILAHTDRLEKQLTKAEDVAVKVEAISSLLKEVQIGLNNTSEKLDGLIRVAPIVTDPARQLLLEESLLLHPAEYTEFAARLPNLSTSPTAIGLMGSLVGFTVTVAHHLGLLAYKSRHRGFGDFHIIGSRIANDDDGAAGTWSVQNFQLQLIKSFVLAWNKDEIFNSDIPWRLCCESVYLSHDLLSAALIVKGDSLIVLQSLSPLMLENIIKRQGHLVGIRHPFGGGGQYVFERYNEAFKRFREAGASTKDRFIIRYGEKGGQKQIFVETSGLIFPLLGDPGHVGFGSDPEMKRYVITPDSFESSKQSIMAAIEEKVSLIGMDYQQVFEINKLAEDHLRRFESKALL